ncbi:MAG: aspartate/glutamate racemase family protein [Tissierella sp.]|uniref:aspartate/glutamate racemase family protein n=1 Tax=Tissierella sp. TaxID=41274 RepID=UPI003F9B19E6
MKRLGILGGMGPKPTIKLFQTIVDMTEAHNDQENIHIIIDNNTKIPDRTSFLLDNTKEDPLPILKESAKRLEEAGADIIVMPCNTAHYYYEEIKNSINISFLNMIEETAIYIKKRYPDLKKIGLLATDGTIKMGIYDKMFSKYGIGVINPCKNDQRYIYDLIYNIKENKEQKSLDGVYVTMEKLEKEGAEIFIAGCTEVSVALDKFDIEGKFIDPMEVLARRSIEFVGAKLKK